jgi:hypothetical protein
MKYHAPTGQFTIDREAIGQAALNLRYALKTIRKIAGLPLDRYAKPKGALTDACYAQITILEAAETLGIDLGVTRHRFNELDLRDAP